MNPSQALAQSRMGGPLGIPDRQWDVAYALWEDIPETAPHGTQGIYELIPDEEATNRFWNRYARMWE